jgi:hypothetical protein
VFGDLGVGCVLVLVVLREEYWFELGGACEIGFAHVVFVVDSFSRVVVELV